MRLNKFILFFLLFLCGQLFAQDNSDKIISDNGKKFHQHIVKKGETVYGLSKDYNVAARDIVMENPKAMEGISAGDTLRIPFESTAVKLNVDTGADRISGKYIYHKVVAKETRYSLGKQYKVSLSTLDSLNPELKTKGLLVGQTLKIPVVTQTASATAPKNTQPNTTPTLKPPVTAPPIQKDTTKERQAFKNLVNQQHIDTTHKPVNKPIIAPPPLTQPTIPTTPVAVDKTKLLNRYNVALIMPFASQNTDTMRMSRLLDNTEQLPLYTQISAEFYQGVMIALDSLEKKGVKVDLHLYNISSTPDTTVNRIDSIVKSPGFETTNLIIGPPSTAHFRQMERYANQHHIPIVSPIVADNGVLQNNTYASKVTPSSVTEVEKMADYITAHYMKSNIVLLHHRDAADEVYFDTFKKKFKVDAQIASENDSVVVADYSDNLEILGNKLKENVNNVIVVPYQGASFVAKLVNKLANSKYADNNSIVLFGMHNWLSNDNLDMADLDTLNFHFPSNDYVNYSDSCTRGFIKSYRYNYYTEPSYYAYQGFDIAYYYIGLLWKYGTAIPDHLGDARYIGAHTSFEMRKPADADGYDNKAIYILEYRNYQIVKSAQ